MKAARSRWNGEQRIEDADWVELPPRFWHRWAWAAAIAWSVALHGFALWGFMDAMDRIFGLHLPI